MNIRQLLTSRFEQAFAAVDAADAAPLVQPASKPEFGHYQANGVMGAAKRLKTNPRALAQSIVESVDLAGIACDLTIAGPGFINIVLDDDFIAAVVAADKPLIDTTSNPQIVVVDLSSPNLAKEMHVGHLRSTIIGDAVACVLEALGHKVIRQNHVGDWGTQFGMLLAHLQETGRGYQQLADLEEFYRVAKSRFDSDAEFAERSRATVVKLQAGDADTLVQWRNFVDISRDHCLETYQRLGSALTAADVRGESTYNDNLPGVVASLDEIGLLTESDGARCVFLDQFKGKDGAPLPVIVQKSDGGYLYASTDLAAVRYRNGTLHADRVLYFTDSRQSLHFAQIFAVARHAGFARAEMSLEHHPFGNMLGADGKPFKTREGGVVKLNDLLDEAVTRAADLVEAKNPQLTTAERDNIAQVVGIGAVKFADLSKNRTSDYIFDWDQMLSFEGNTAPYLQYAYSRIASIFRRGAIDPHTPGERIILTATEERSLALMLMKFQEVLEQVAADAFPHYLCSYLHELATKFMRFYEACPILTAEQPHRSTRLQLCSRTRDTLQQGLALLGISTVERM